MYCSALLGEEVKLPEAIRQVPVAIAAACVLVLVAVLGRRCRLGVLESVPRLRPPTTASRYDRYFLTFGDIELDN